LSDRAGIIAGGKLIEIASIDEIGGADARVPIVRWSDANGHHEQRTNEPGKIVTELMKTGSEPKNLEIVRPSLEDIYINLVEAYENAASTSSSTSSATTSSSIDKETVR
jgi:ABC-2 type transport system ATP-binding protein